MNVPKSASSGRLEPSLTAQTSERYDACPSALIRDLEVSRFLALNKLPPLVPDEENPKLVHERAKRLSQIIADVPLYSARFKFGKPIDVARFVRREAVRRNLELETGDAAFCVTTIRKRNALVEALIAKAGRKGVTVEWDFDTRTVRAELGKDKVPVEGTINGMVTVSSRRGRYVLLLDFTTGYAPHRPDRTNRQFTTLAALAAVELERAGLDLKGTEVLVAVLNRNDVPADKAESLHYGPGQLAAAVQWLTALAEDRGRLIARYRNSRDADGTPAPRFGAALDKAAKMGDQCKHCSGAICCGKLRASMRALTREVIQVRGEDLVKRRALVNQSIERLPQAFSADSQTATPELPMNIDTLASTLEISNTLRVALELPKKVYEEASDLTRQLHEKSVTVPGWELKPGAKRFNVRSETPVAESGAGKSAPSDKLVIEKRDSETTPHAIYERLEPILAGMSFREFVKRTCKAEPAAVEAMIADLTGVPQKQVFEKVLVPQLGAKNPFEMRPNKPSVVPATRPAANAAPLPESPKKTTSKGRS